MAELLTLYPSLAQVEPSLVSLGTAAIPMQVPLGTVLFEENKPCQGLPMVLSW